MKILHIADIHLGKSFSTKEESLREFLVNNHKETFRNGIEYAISTNIDGVLIAGDLFENLEFSFRTEKFVVDEFNRLKKAGIPVFYCSGNHDYTSELSAVRKIDYPDNVHLFFDETPKVVEIENRYRVVGCGHNNRKEGRDLIAEYPRSDKDGIWIGIGHSMIDSILSDGTEGAYMHSSIETLLDKEYDYWALGHIHQSGRIDPRVPAYYSGSMQGLNPKEIGQKGGNLITFSPSGEINVECIQFSPMEWEAVEIKIGDKLETLKDIYDYIFGKINDHLESGGRKANTVLLRVRLTGRHPLATRINESVLLLDYAEEIKLDLDLVHAELISEVKQLYSLEALTSANSILAEMLKSMETEEALETFVSNMGDIKLLNTTEMEQGKEHYIKDKVAESVDAIIGRFMEDMNEIS